MKYISTVNGNEFVIEVLDEHHIVLEEVTYQVDFESVSGQPVYSLIVDGNSHEAHVYQDNGDWQVLLKGRLYNVKVEDEREKRLRAASGGRPAQSGEFHLKAPMPGLVVSLPIIEGQTIEKGDVLAILESMKMQNELKSPRHGTVSRIRVKKGDIVDQKQTILSVL